MKLVPEVAWRGEELLDPRLLPLLRAVRERGTLKAAAQEGRMSYRGAWDVLAAASRSLGAALVVSARGQGARLTPLGEKLVAADREARSELARFAARLSVPIKPETAPALRLAASHDPLLASLCESERLPLDVSFKGSAESLKALARGEADIAGFHVGDGRGAAAGGGSMLRLLPRRHLAVRFASREQGLLLPKGNPGKVRGLADVIAQGLVFVNRQRGSGTRLLLEQLLDEQALRAADLRGYANEEFTHHAVAATVAAGRADAGLGVKAAAAPFGLAFVPLQRERYWFALRARDRSHPALGRLLDALRSDGFRRLARRHAGYDVQGAGDICAVADLVAGDGR